MAVITPEIVIVGCGPGGGGYVTPEARRWIEEAEVLAAAARLQEMFPKVCAERIVVGTDIEAALNALAQKRNCRIVVAVSGDPGISSLARPVIERFGSENCRVIPGVSAVQTAFARIGQDWTDARILSFHGKDPAIDAHSLESSKAIAILGGNQKAVQGVIDLLARLETERRVYVCENLTLENETVRRATCAELETLQCASRTVFLLIQENKGRAR